MGVWVRPEVGLKKGRRCEEMAVCYPMVTRWVGDAGGECAWWRGDLVDNI